MVLKIKNARKPDEYGFTQESVSIESNFIETCKNPGTVVRAVFDGSNEKFLRLIAVASILNLIRDSFEGDNINTKNTIAPKPTPSGYYVFKTKFGEVVIGPTGNDGMYDIVIQGLDHKDCNLEVYINDQRVN